MGNWNAAWLLLPTGTSSPALGDDNIRELKVEVGGRLDQEHVILNTATTGASVHRPGSAVVYLQDAEPTLRPDGVTTFDVSDHGRIWIDSNDGNHVYVYNGTDAEMQELTVAHIANDGDLVVAGDLTVGGEVQDHLYLSSTCIISTGGEDTPDCSPGGICLNQNDNVGDLITLKGTGRIDQPFTNYAEADTFGQIGQYSTDGGLKISGYSENYYGLWIRGSAVNAQTTTSIGSTGAIRISAHKSSGTANTFFDSNDNILTISNNNYCRLLLKGDGDLYLDGTTSAYDNENDIELARALQLGIAKQPTIEPYRKRLEELKIMKNGFVSSKGFMALSLGTLHQIWNGLKAVAKRLDISEVELFELAKGEV